MMFFLNMYKYVIELVDLSINVVTFKVPRLLATRPPIFVPFAFAAIQFNSIQFPHSSPLPRLPQTPTAAGHRRWQRATVLEYYVERAGGTLQLLAQLDLIGRTAELAKLFGIQFFEVLARGSQFRVESMMLRMAKPRNIVPVSPSVKQRAHMRAPEHLPLIMEPLSRLYCEPVIVLDFQSLYPSQIIAYNYCYSTCLGRVEHLGG